MSHTIDHDPFWGLPDPDSQPEFYADIPVKRVIAWLIDAVVVGVISAIIVPFTAFTALFFFPALLVIVSVIYRTWTLTAGSSTWGMRLTGLEMRTRAGTRLDGGTALVHTVLYTIFNAIFLPQLASLLLILMTRRSQNLTDVILGTAAINKAARG